MENYRSPGRQGVGLQVRAATSMTFDPVILSIIRRVMPTTIANDIIGVQPMSGLNIAPWIMKMEKVHYQHFLRLNNRKKTQKISNIDEAGYTCVKLYRSWNDPREWCKKNLKPGSYINLHTRFWFAYDRDATLFTLRWSS